MRRLASLVALASSVSLLPAMPARAGGPTPLPPDTILDIRGHGWGHARGMGQWGAKGMADDGSSYAQILDHYYQAGPSTSGSEPLVAHGQRGNPTIRVLVEASQDVIVTSVEPFRIRPHGATSALFTSGAANPFWRITYAGGDYRYARAAEWNGPWDTVHTDARYADILPGERMLEVVRNSGTVRRYRGSITARWSTVDGMRAINNLPLEDYLRGVVPRESPSGWPAAALRAQSVAARTYAHRYRSASRAGGNTFDICGTTTCQVYEGNAGRSSPGGSLDDHEVASTDAAIAATEGEVLLYDSDPILAEYSSSTGGYTAPGSVPYQRAVPDPGDRVSPHHDWSKSLRVTEIEGHFPSIGRLVRIDVTDRNGYGEWGGRVLSLRLVGTDGTRELSGYGFQGEFGLRSSWFTIGIIRAERAGVPTSTTIPRGETKSITLRYRNVGSDPWFVGGELQIETDAPSVFRHDAWISGSVVARIARNADRPAANLVEPDEVAEFVVPIDATTAPVGDVVLPLRLLPIDGRIIDRVNLDVSVVESWIEAAPNLLTSGSFESGVTGWTLNRPGELVDGRDVTRGLVFRDVTGHRVLEQRIDLAGGSGRRFLLGGWAKLRDASARAVAELTYESGSTDRVVLDDWTGEDWDYAERGFRTSRTRRLDAVAVRIVTDISEGGRAAFDAIRLVEDPIGDPSFEEPGLGPWSVLSQPASDAPSRIHWASADGGSALRVPGATEPTVIEQRFELDANAWDRLTLRFAERTFGATLGGDDTWRVRLTLEHPDASETTGSIDLNPAMHAWRNASLELRPEQAVHHARIRIEVAEQTGRADLDAFRLLRSRERDPSFESSGAWGVAGFGGNDGLLAAAARDGARGVRLDGPQEAATSQRFPLRGTRARTLRVGFFDEVTGALEPGDIAEVAITFFHRDGSSSTERIPLGVRAHPWSYREAIVASTGAYDEVRATVSSRRHDGVVHVDQLLITDA
jgi:SpoIID/LytB domain protein